MFIHLQSYILTIFIISKIIELTAPTAFLLGEVLMLILSLLLAVPTQGISGLKAKVLSGTFSHI
jgi:hypothetical protein